jgi:vitamin B12 transporter
MARLATVLLLLAIPCSVSGEEGGPHPSAVVVEGEPEVVRPPDGEEPRLTGSGYLPGARTRIDLEKYRGTLMTVADVLREAPGVTVVRSGDALAPAKVTIRGSRPDQVLILLDGVSLNRQTDNPARGRRTNRQGYDLSKLSVERVESIEILRGAGSSLYGPDAAAGVILIRTRRPRQRGVMLRRTVGPGGFRENEAEWVQPFDDASLTVNLNHRETRGEFLFFDPTADDPAATTSAAAEACAPLQGGGFRLRRCNARDIDTLAVTLRRGDEQRWSLELERSDRQGLGGVLDPRPFGREEQTRYAVGFADRLPLGDERHFGLALNALRLEGHRTENETASVDALENDHTERRAEAEGWYEHWLGGHHLRYGGALSRETIEDRYFAAGRSRRSGYGRWRWHRERGTLECSLRHDDLSALEGRTTFRVGASRFVSGGFGLKASHATGFRPPTLYELFDPGSPFGPSPANPDLLPERSRSSDGGVFYEIEGSLYAELLYFRQDVRDDIVAIADPQTTSLFRFENVSRTRSTGWEAAFSLRGRSGFSLDLGWTLMEAVVPEVPGNVRGGACTWRRGTAAGASSTRRTRDSSRPTWWRTGVFRFPCVTVSPRVWKERTSPTRATRNWRTSRRPAASCFSRCAGAIRTRPGAPFRNRHETSPRPQLPRLSLESDP